MSDFSNPRAYETWMGRWSERLAPLFLEFAELKEPGRYLDVGSGTGVFARYILEEIDDSEVLGLEPSSSYVEFARRKISDPRVSFQVGDAQEIPFEDDAFDASLALLVLQEIPDAKKAVSEMRRVTRSGGCIAACQWDFVSGMPSLSYFWETVSEILPKEQAIQDARERVPAGYSNVDALAGLWANSNLINVKTAELEIQMEFVSFEDYWGPFLGGATPTSSYAATLTDDQQAALANRLRSRILENGPDRSFSIPATALAVRGYVP
jgi:SAM-dependent methyltransferase